MLVCRLFPKVNYFRQDGYIGHGLAPKKRYDVNNLCPQCIIGGPWGHLISKHICTARTTVPLPSYTYTVNHILPILRRAVYQIGHPFLALSQHRCITIFRTVAGIVRATGTITNMISYCNCSSLPRRDSQYLIPRIARPV